MVLVLEVQVLLWRLCKFIGSLLTVKCKFSCYVYEIKRWFWYLCNLVYWTFRYGSTKCGLRQLQSSLLKECRRSNVGVHTASPGMVLTDLLLRWIKFILTILVSLYATDKLLEKHSFLINGLCLPLSQEIYELVLYLVDTHFSVDKYYQLERFLLNL